MRKLIIILYRCSWVVFLAQLVASFVWDFSWWWGWIPLAAAIVLAFLVNRPPARTRTSSSDTGEPIEVEPPVVGRWSALNSPADKVPSHGAWFYGQSHAIDLVAEPEPERSHPPTSTTRPGLGWWPLMRRAQKFPGFGAEVVAVAAGTVVVAVDRHRDHLSRNSYPALMYLSFEGMARDIIGVDRIIGNRVVLDLGNGVYALYGHLQRNSLKVRPGDRVQSGQLLARCGNSGNSSEPHVHFQLMDNVDATVARGIPFTWRGLGVPKGGQVITVGGLPAGR